MNRKRLVVVLVAAVLLGPAGGCVYLRFQALQNQLRQFDRHFDISDKDGLTVAAKNPVLLSNDIVWLTNLEPTKDAQTDEGQCWTYHFRKLLPDGEKEQGDFDPKIELHFRNDKLYKLRLSKQLHTVMPTGLFVLMLKSIGHAKVDLDKRSITTSDISSDTSSDKVEATTRPSLPVSGHMVKIFGKPYKTEHSKRTFTLIYRYELEPAAKAKAKNEQKHWIRLTFRKDDQKLSKIESHFFGLKTWIRFAPQATR